MSNTTTNRGRKPKGAGNEVTQRKRRVPMSGSRQRMQLDEREMDKAFHYAWINDTGSLLHSAQRAGYEHVYQSEMPSWGVRDVDSANATGDTISMPVGRGVTAYLMKQPIEFYEEDKVLHDEQVDQREADMKRQLNSTADGRYGKVSIERQL